jgi:hypothetical protein
MTKPHTRLSRWAHRRGIARAVNATYEKGRYRRASVDTCLPLAVLARYGCHWFYGAKVVERERIGRWQWRWELRP